MIWVFDQYLYHWLYNHEIRIYTGLSILPVSESDLLVTKEISNKYFLNKRHLFSGLPFTYFDCQTLSNTYYLYFNGELVDITNYKWLFIITGFLVFLVDDSESVWIGDLRDCVLSLRVQTGLFILLKNN